MSRRDDVREDSEGFLALTIQKAPLGGASQTARGSAVHGILQALARLEGGVLAGRDIDFLSGLGVATLARCTFADLKGAKPHQRHRLAFSQLAADYLNQ